MRTASKEEKEKALDRVYLFVMQGPFRLFLDDLEKQDNTREKSKHEAVEGVSLCDIYVTSPITALQLSTFLKRVAEFTTVTEWKILRETTDFTAFWNKRVPFSYKVEGAVEGCI